MSSSSWAESYPGVSNVLRYRTVERGMTAAVLRRLLLFNYNDAFDTPGELCSELACAADSEIGGDIDAMDLPVCFGIP